MGNIVGSLLPAYMSETPARVSGWQRLPTEIRLNIIEFHLDDLEKTERLSPYATISVEYRDAIEKRTFRSVAVRRRYLDSFPNFIRGVEKRVRNIIFDIELSDLGDQLEDHAVVRGSLDVAHTVKTIFSTLSKLDKHPTGRTVQLNIRRDIFKDVTNGLITETIPSSPLTGVFDGGVVEAFAGLSTNLTHLSLSFVADAEAFLNLCLLHGSWPNMESFVLTCEALDPDTDEAEASSVILLAAKLALKMPRLTTMVIWNGAGPKVCAFKYLRERDSCSIATRAPWYFDLEDDCETAWRNVAKQYVQPTQLYLTQQYIGAVHISSFEDAMLSLELPSDVFGQGLDAAQIVALNDDHVAKRSHGRGWFPC